MAGSKTLLRAFRRARISALVLVAAVGLAGCRSFGHRDPSDPIPTAGAAYPLTLHNCGRKVVFHKAPTRVMVLNGASVGEVESFIMLGLQGHILANAQSYPVSDDPAMVAAVKAVPTGGLRINGHFDVPAEQVFSARPDLVVATAPVEFDAKSGFATREQLAAAGINSLVNPVNCAMNNPGASQAEKRAYQHESIESSFDFMTLLGRIFHIDPAGTIAKLRARIQAVRARVAGLPPKRVAILFPGMSMMNENGLPAVMTGGIYDDVIKAAGGVNSFAGESSDATRTITKEQLAAATVDVLVIGEFTAQEDPAAEARKIFATYPQWQASKTGTYAVVSDGVYLGPVNAWAVEKLAGVIHPHG